MPRVIYFMKTKFLLFVFFVVIAPAVAQNSAETDEQLIKDLVVNSFQDIFSDNRSEMLQEYYTPDFLLLERGEVWDIEIIKGYMDRAAEMNNIPERINSFNFLAVKISGDMAWTAYKNKAIFKVGDEVMGEVNWLESATAIKTTKGWRLQMLHSTEVKPENEE